MVVKTIKLKNLNLNALSVVKYFYQKGVETNSTIQNLLYLSYLEVLKKENVLLFEEEFQAWRAGPTLHSVFYTLHDYSEKNQNYEGLFNKIPSLKNKTVIQYLENIYRQYEKYEVQKKQLEFYEKTKDKAWKITRKPLNDSLKSRPIKLTTLTNSLGI
ncbi:MAG: hypothetical protein I3273_00770 [Candidatus Moeniiplasma glomeromycotorum]|nr:hypothetical protein [Candidatus Moeniiplasma glomeromycotorum]MCE8167344.1 hypothetical protein [Candidatus Moeniiplasma glomeromycotorum]MCE8168643.1 hypothetical protein [Candidatus Moeniiplasma glomeromycotorum]